MNENHLNSVHIEGAVTDCVLMPRNGGLTAYLTVFTDNNDYSCHRVRLRAHEKTAPTLHDISSTCRRNRDSYAADGSTEPCFISANGHLRLVGRSLVIEASEDSFSRVDTCRPAATATVKGTAVEKKHSDLCAGVLLRTSTPEGESLLIPLSVLQNKPAFGEIVSDRTVKGDTIEVSGHLRSELMSDGKTEHTRCTVDATRYRNLSLTTREQQQEQRTAKKGVTIH